MGETPLVLCQVMPQCPSPACSELPEYVARWQSDQTKGKEKEAWKPCMASQASAQGCLSRRAGHLQPRVGHRHGPHSVTQAMQPHALGEYNLARCFKTQMSSPWPPEVWERILWPAAPPQYSNHWPPSKSNNMKKRKVYMVLYLLKNEFEIKILLTIWNNLHIAQGLPGNKEEESQIL